MSPENHLSDGVARCQSDGVELRDVLQFQRERATVPARIAVAGVEMFQTNACHAGLQAILRADVCRKVEHLDGRRQQEATRRDVEATLRSKINLIHAQRFALRIRHRLAAVGLDENLRGQMDVDAAGIDSAIADVRDDASFDEFNEFVIL